MNKFNCIPKIESKSEIYILFYSTQNNPTSSSKNYFRVSEGIQIFKSSLPYAKMQMQKLGTPFLFLSQKNLEN